jgi:hypothetical protein
MARHLRRRVKAIHDKGAAYPAGSTPLTCPPPAPQSPLLLFRYQPHTRESAAAAYESAVNTKPQHERIGREASRAGARGSGATARAEDQRWVIE